MIGLITARGGSKGIPNKNMVLLDNKPLLYYTIEAAKKSKLKETWITSDSNDILKYAESQGIKCISRPKHLAEDDTPSIEVVKHAVSIIGEEKVYCLLQPTSPLRTFMNINSAINLFENDNSTLKSLVSVQKIDHKFVPESVMVKNQSGYLIKHHRGEETYRRQDKKIYFGRNGAAIYIFNGTNINKNLLEGNIISYEMNKIESIDIDDFEDLFITESIILKKNV